MGSHKSVPISMDEATLRDIDARAAALGLSRSAYIQQLIRKDLGRKAAQLPTSDSPPSGEPASAPKFVLVDEARLQEMIRQTHGLQETPASD